MNLPQVYVFPERFGNVRRHRRCMCVQEKPVCTDHFEASLMLFFQQELTQANNKLTEKQFSFEMLYEEKCLSVPSALFVCHFSIMCGAVVEQVYI